MSRGPLNFKGRPNTDDQDTVRLLRYCGGAGGGGCLEPLGATGILLPYRVPKYITYNRKIILENKEFFGPWIFDDGGPDGFFCDHTIGDNEKTWFIGLTFDSGADIEAVAKAGYELSGEPPYDIEFPADMCPQPTEAAWESIVYVAVYWGDPNLMNNSVSGQITVASFEIKKHDKDSRQ